MQKYTSRGEITPVSISPFYSKFQRVPSKTSDGVLCPGFQFVEYSAKEKVYSSEFSLGNLIAIGSFDNLSYVSLSLNSDMNFVDSFSSSYQKLVSDVTEIDKSQS